MAEPTIGLKYSDLRSQIAVFVGWNPTASAWTTAQSNAIAQVLADGQRDFYEEGEDWTFLKTTTTIATIANTVAAALPDNFAEICDQKMFYAAGLGYQPICQTDMARISELTMGNFSAGPMRYFAIRSKTAPSSAGQRFEVAFWPTPDAIYTLTYRYKINPDVITSDNYPYGGAQHAGTLKDCIFARAEMLLKPGAPPVYQQRARDSIERSKLADRRLRPTHVGQVTDNSDGTSRKQVGYDFSDWVTYNGTLYGDY